MHAQVDWLDWVVWMLVTFAFWIVLLGAVVYSAARFAHRPPTKPRTG